jgi:hypothetical protein
VHLDNDFLLGRDALLYVLLLPPKHVRTQLVPQLDDLIGALDLPIPDSGIRV